AGPPLGPRGIGRLVLLAPRGLPTLAVGGITADNGGDLIRAGVMAVAVSSALQGAREPDHAAARLLGVLRRAAVGPRRTTRMSRLLKGGA
ncbi:MAG: hypothetical protein AAB368_13635, partial [bacterium]